jgi:hypothetical protein
LPKNVTASKKGESAGVVAWAVALALLAAGLAVILGALAPIRVGDVDSEIGALGEAAATGPLLLIGLAASLFMAVRTASRWTLLLLAGLGLTLGLLLAGGLFLLGLDLPLAWNAAATMAPEQARAVKVVVTKSLVLLVIEMGSLLVLGLLGARWWHAVGRSTTNR